ncbi:MAG TPA: nucleotidyl transferase AbiEii/AbiGii toxin family protein [Ilumatobacter sp.]|nr:nucleotidyl transferase AbiEii/AbiGii toxin family protein [Ilumatobacter sp.]
MTRGEPNGQQPDGQFAPTQHADAASHLPAFPSDLVDFMPSGTVETWQKIAPLVPAAAYLVGGTALTVHLRHRVSRDLDFFFDGHVDIDALEAALQKIGKLATTSKGPDTLNGVLGSTRIQFLEARNQQQLAAPTHVAGIQVASVEDILAMKLKVILDRGELRDYFDIMRIDEHVVPVEEGIDLFMRRYGVGRGDNNIAAILSTLSYLGDVADDPMLPVKRPEIERYWTQRTPEIAKSFDRY